MIKRKNIFRIDTDGGTGTHGWQVRLQRRGRLYSKFFSDSQHDSAEAALTAATQYRDELLEELGAPDQNYIAERRHEAISRTGVLGIGFTMVAGKTGELWPYVQATHEGTEGWNAWKYSVRKHGLRGALTLAARALSLARHGDFRAVGDLVEEALPGLEAVYEQECAP